MEEHIIPPEVTNIKQYKKYLALKNHPMLKNPVHTASDGTEINIGVLPNMLRKKIAGLSLKEQEHFMELKTAYNKIAAKISVAKRLAFKREDLPQINDLTPFHADILELLGKMFTINEVVKIMGEDNGIIVTEADVKKVLRENISEIERRREQFRDRVSDVRLYNKRPRLEELAWMYSRMKLRYIAVNSTDAYNAMLRTLEQIRKEAEGDIINVRGVLDVNIEAKIQQHIQNEILKTINLKEIILGRVAARMNYDVAKLVAGLHNSYYAKFVDISDRFDENAEMRYPSASPYDFEDIQTHAEEKTVDMTPEPIPEEKSDEANLVKQMFLTKIRNQKKQIKTRNTNIDILTRDKVSERQQEESGKVNYRKGGRGELGDKKLHSKKKSVTSNKVKRDYYTGEKINS